MGEHGNISEIMGTRESMGTYWERIGIIQDSMYYTYIYGNRCESMGMTWESTGITCEAMGIFLRAQEYTGDHGNTAWGWGHSHWDETSPGHSHAQSCDSKVFMGCLP